MRYHLRYWLWSRGNHKSTLQINLRPDRRYLITGFLTLKRGDDFAQVYLSTVCRQRVSDDEGGFSGDQVLCGLRPRTIDSNIVERLTSTSRVYVTLETHGGSHRAEGVVYEL